MASSSPRIPSIAAAANWRRVEFISDLHLQEAPAATFELWRHYMQGCTADALFVLGDLFEVWIGDDAAFDAPQGRMPGSSFEGRCLQVLRETAGRMPVHFMRGNRDFLVGPRLLEACGVVDLADPVQLVFDRHHLVLSHGDALCLGDTDYQAFRAKVRTRQWQRQFLEQPLAQRRSSARQMREQSEAHKRSAVSYADVDIAAARDMLLASGAATMIHGHTHRPARHDLGDGMERVVLSDWDADARPPRAEVLRLDADGQHRLSVDDALRTGAA